MARDSLLTTAQAAADFGFSPGHVARLAQSGKVTGEKWGRDWCINRASMEAYAASWQLRKPGPKRFQQERGQQ